MNRRFLVRLEYDSEYQGYVASVPSLPGCMSQGKTEQEALANIEDAIALFLESLRETGRELAPNLLRAQIKLAGLTEEEFLRLRRA